MYLLLIRSRMSILGIALPAEGIADPEAVAAIRDHRKETTDAPHFLRHALRAHRRAEAKVGRRPDPCRRPGDRRKPRDNIFFVIREGRGINFVEHGEHLPAYVENAAADSDLIERLK
jgi:hypothetical protein